MGGVAEATGMTTKVVIKIVTVTVADHLGCYLLDQNLRHLLICHIFLQKGTSAPGIRLDHCGVLNNLEVRRALLEVRRARLEVCRALLEVRGALLEVRGA